MNKVGLGLVFLLVITQILVLNAMVHESEAPLPGQNPLSLELSDQKANNIANQPVAGSTVSPKVAAAAEAPNIRRLGKHHSTDKSVAGGGVIIGGLVTAIFAAVFCYIRVTRKRESGY